MKVCYVALPSSTAACVGITWGLTLTVHTIPHPYDLPHTFSIPVSSLWKGRVACSCPQCLLINTADATSGLHRNMLCFLKSNHPSLSLCFPFPLCVYLFSFPFCLSLSSQALSGEHWVLPLSGHSTTGITGSLTH